MKELIIAALKELNVENDDHWTGDGLPRVDVIETAIEKNISRSDITAAAPRFTRRSPEIVIPEGNEIIEGGKGVVINTEVKAEIKTEELELKGKSKSKKRTSEEVTEDEFNAAQANLEKALLRFEAAQAAMDEVITARSAKGANDSPGSVVKQFQASQMKQRAGDLNKRKLAIKLLADSNLL